MVYTSAGVTDSNHIVPLTSTPDKKPSARKSLCLFTNILDVKRKTAKCCVESAKSKRKAIELVTRQCTKKGKREGN